MAKKIKPQTLKGFRDFLPQQMRGRNYVLGVFKEVFEMYGFEPLETPSLEYAETLMGKYGEEADRLVYRFQDRGGREIAMPYDLTVPVSKVLAMYPNKITLPFKRYQIQRVWRAEKPQKGRYREILQCDVDIFGVKSPLADAQIIAVIYTILKKLNFKKFTIGISSRQVLSETWKKLEDEAKIRVSEIREREQEIYRIIDKKDKISIKKLDKEMRAKGFTINMNNFIALIEKTAKPDDYLQKVIDYSKQLGVDGDRLKFIPTLVRGLDYYTGPVFETIVEKPKIGSITGGGRYDNLIEQLGGPSIPATGTTIGLDRICNVIEELGLLKNEIKPTTKVLVTIFSPEYKTNSIEAANKLRAAGINTELYPDPEAKLDKQLKYADRKGIPYAIIIGPEEVGNSVVAVKNMTDGTQEILGLDKLITTLI